MDAPLEEDVNFLKFGALGDGDHLSNASVALLLRTMRTTMLEEAPGKRMPECVDCAKSLLPCTGHSHARARAPPPQVL